MKAQLWDLAGQPTFEQVRAGFLKGDTGALLVYSVTDNHSFDNIRNWVTKIHGKCGKGKIPIVIVGNKIDLRNDGDTSTISNEIGQKLVTELSRERQTSMIHVPASALTGENVELAFRLMAAQTCIWISRES